MNYLKQSILGALALGMANGCATTKNIDEYSNISCSVDGCHRFVEHPINIVPYQWPAESKEEELRREKLAELGTLYYNGPWYVMLGTDKTDSIEELVRQTILLYADDNLTKKRIYDSFFSSSLEDFGMNIDWNKKLNGLEDDDVSFELITGSDIQIVAIPIRLRNYDYENPNFIEGSKWYPIRSNVQVYVPDDFPHQYHEAPRKITVKNE